MKQVKTNDTQTAVVGPTESERTGGNVLDFSTTLRELRHSVDPQLVRQRAARRDRDGNLQMVDYVEWHTVADILDEHASNWTHAVKDIRPIGEFVTITVAITIDGVTREGIGTGRANSETGIKKAEHDALKRAAVKFGIARELYKREFDSLEYETSTEPAASPSLTSIGDPVAKSLGDMVTTRQLGMIRAIGRESAVDVDAECNALLHCSVDELSKRAASNLIEHLQSMVRNSGAVSMPIRRAS